MTKDRLRVLDYLEHMLQAIRRISRYTQDMSGAEFLNNEMAQDALIRNIEVIGEAANNIRQNYSEFALKHSHVPWDDVYLMRNRVGHGYFSVDLDIVWKTVQHDLPELERQATIDKKRIHAP